MLRTKKDVDRHVQDIFRKLQDENERTLRSFKIAELYYHVNDYETARRYLSRFIEVRKDAKAHKLMGQILEAIGQKEAALIQYKYSFELNIRQEDLLLKICELMADPEVGIDINRAKYWVDRTDKHFPRHKIIFQLREKILSIERPTNNEEDLENLITVELAARPTDVHLRVKLLKYYMEKGKLDEAYKHAIDIEGLNIHRDSLVWYQVLCELFLKCKNNRQLNWSFWISYVSSLERYAALSLKEQGHAVKRTSEAIQAVYNFDQHLLEAKSQSFSSYPSLTESIFVHMWGQLHFHMACLLLQNTQRDQSSWSEAGRLCAPLLMTAVHVKPIDITASWATHIDTSMKNQLQIWYREGSYRCSQAGHILHDYSRGNQKKLVNNIEKFCTGSWRERIYQRIFVGNMYQKVRTSYFTNNNTMNPSLRLISSNEQKRFNEVAEEVYPYSLHHQVWPGIKIRNNNSQNSSKQEGPQPNLSSHLFPDLQFSVYNVNQASPVTLCRLDVDAFLNAAVLCANAVVEDQQRNNLLHPDRLTTLPADLTKPLCTEEQEKWWSAAYKMYSKEPMDDIGETRQNLNRGLEVVRCIGNHGLHPVILVHLARIFHYRAKQLREKNSESSDIPALESRSELYWSAVVPLLEKLQNNQTIHTSHVKLFDYFGKDMNNMELTHAIEEGKLLLVQKLVRDKLYEQAVDALQALKCPEASFEQGKIYRMLADDHKNSLSKEYSNSENGSQHLIFILSKARNCFYLTLDRLRSPDADPKHPLNAELCTHITSVENELKRIDPDTLYIDRNRNDCDDYSDESYSSAHSVEHPVVTNSLPILNNSLQTPVRSIRRTPRQSSTPRVNQDILDVSRNRHEARPSPERLDAQIRHLVHSIESLKEQNREQYRAVLSKLDELIKINARKEHPKPRSQPPASNHNIEEDLYGVYGEDDYRDYNNYSGTSMHSGTRANAFTQNMIAASAQRHAYTQLMYPNPAALQGYYQSGHLPFPDPTAPGHHLPGLYPGAAAAAAAGVYPMSPMYRGLEQPLPAIQQMSESVLQHGIFGQRLGPQLGDYSVSQPHLSQQQLNQQIGQLHINPDQTKSEPKIGYPTTSESNALESKENTNIATVTPAAPSTAVPRKVPPVNVVITTSDTLPTTTPTVQPTLSVTIPAQHRLGVSAAQTTTTPAVDSNGAPLPHSYQISMPSQPTIPTTVNLPPLSTTITMSLPAIKSQVTDNQNSSIVSTGSRHSNSDATEVEHDPIPDFAPIIPLPDEVPVTTGEENEEELFCARAKLFRFVDKEWKERGIGNVKLLKNKEGKVRLLMRREQVHKICANHMLRKDMELTMMPNNEKAYMWVANDFADEELRLEKLCIRFKTPEEASDFKKNFEKARDSLTEDSPKTVASTDKLIAKPVKSELTTSKPTEKIGGFSFTSTPIIQKAPELSETTQKKPEETSKPSPFASFSFVKPTDVSVTKTTAITSSSFSFGGSTTAATPTLFGQDPVKSVLNKLNIPVTTEPVKPSSKVNTSKVEQKPLSELFKPAAGSWECTQCYTRNNATAGSCVACQHPSPNATAVPKSTVLASTVSAPVLTPGVKPLSEEFKRPSGSWECKQCYVLNTQSNQYCAACDTAQDPTMPPKPKTSGGFLINSDTPDTKSTFTFGIPKESTVNQTCFSFNLTPKPSEKTVTSPISIFGSNKAPSSSGFEFGTQPPSTPPNSNSGKYIFGSPGKSFDFQFQAKSPPIKSPERPETSDDETVEEAEDIYFTPVIPLPDKIEVKTGEENEEVLYSHRAKLFKFDAALKEWKERGLGDIKLLRHVENKKLRLVMRRDQVLKLCLNHALTSALEITSKDDKTWMWSAGDYSEGEIEYMQFACRFKTAEIANEFKQAVDNAVKSKESSADTPAIPKSTKKESSPDIEVVFEITVTPEEKAEALKLKLPENFYAYKYKPPCPGCLGCGDADDFEFTDKKKQPLTVKLNAPVFKASGITSTTSNSIPMFSNTLEKPTTTTTASVTPVFGGKSTFVFGNQPIVKPDSIESDVANLKICSPNNIFTRSPTTSSEPVKNIFTDPSKPVFSAPVFSISGAGTNPNSSTDKNIFSNKPFGGSSIFGDNKPPTMNLFGGTPAITSASSTTTTTSSILGNSIFGTSTTTTSLFGGQTSVTPSFGSLATQSSNNQQGQNFDSSVFPVKTPGSTSSPSLFGGDATNQFGSKLTFSNANSTTNFFSNSTAQPASNIFDSKASGDNANKSDVSFLPTENAVSFKTLAAQNPSEKPGFQKDPNFSFEGAGTSVFGAKSASKKKSPKKPPKEGNGDDEDGDEENENGDEHDPYFEPIVPLPDAIEVRTGEEDEEKVFGQRAKLYRYDQNTKEWKERGTGEMKILHHVEHGTYRLLLRREQVFKVVCNLLLTPDIEFHPLNLSDRAWLWAGMNYAEVDQPELEKLAIRFKSPELAKQFKAAVDKAQQDLAERQHQDQKSAYDDNQPDDDYDDDYTEGDEYPEGDENEEEQVQLQMFEKRATLYAQNEGELTWKHLTMGDLKVIYDSGFFGARIVVDSNDEIVSETVITMDTSMQCIEKECTWAATDYALQPPARRTLRAVFSSNHASEEMYKTFKEGKECAVKADIRD